ncbi:ubiquitin-related modifier 1 [Boletus edulis BED1]|uniref:Ubiquitin-related modifier 1 n=1 Tax=Boletus edulis BED1 TaxID=1328754 RepID=A0AAD4G5H7_BOLED|nr:ubiquitin-related modifier 1 [Boletus edulis BED1]KAF8452654.1 ubiquitin-related modifier 1 [Boletus edulis BED1]
MSTLHRLKVEFSGGLELLFGNQRVHTLSLPAVIPVDEARPSEPRSTDVTYLIHYLRTHLLTDRPELFVEGDTIRPGILVLINDTDWELEGEGAYELKNGDEIVFISTLHGG